MTEVSLGKTGITVNKNGFGALPIQRIPQDDAVKLVRRAFERGINFFDTARSYTDSEAKLGVALKGIREQVFIATKTPSVTAAGFWNDLETSLRLLQTDYIDIYQFHNPAFCLNRVTAAACMKRCSRPGNRGRSVSSALLTIVWQ